MNERIRELKEQATKEIWGNDSFNGAPSFEGYELDEEKFAELIVRKCAKVANENVGLFTPGCGNSVLEHFGVEE